VEVQGDVLAQQRVSTQQRISNSGENTLLNGFSVNERNGKAQQEGPEELDRALEQIDAEEAELLVAVTRSVRV